MVRIGITYKKVRFGLDNDWCLFFQRAGQWYLRFSVRLEKVRFEWKRFVLD